MNEKPAGGEFLERLSLQEAIQQAAKAWDCEPARAWDGLRRRMSSGTLRSKTLSKCREPFGPFFDYKDIPSNKWSEFLNQEDRKGWCVPWPVFIVQSDFNDFLQKIGSRTQHEMEGVDQAILLHTYDQISTLSSNVPIGPLIDALGEPNQSAFRAAFVRAIQAGLFDGKGLEFFCQGQWSPLNSTNSKTVIEAFDDATFEKRYVMMAALPLASLMAWATKFDVPLPDRLRGEWHAADITAGPLKQAVPLPPVPTPPADDTKTPLKSKGGRPAHPDKTRMFEYAAKLIESGQYASREDRTQTKKKLVEAVCSWMKDNAFSTYDVEYVEKLLTPMWQKTR